jgi:hypothetical protein
VITSTAGATLYVSGGRNEPADDPDFGQLRSFGIRQHGNAAKARLAALNSCSISIAATRSSRGVRHHQARAVARGSGQSDLTTAQFDGDGGVRRPDLFDRRAARDRSPG